MWVEINANLMWEVGAIATGELLWLQPSVDAFFWLRRIPSTPRPPAPHELMKPGGKKTCVDAASRTSAAFPDQELL